MTKIAFLDTDILGWTGGINYLRNLLFAVNNHSDMKPVFFLVVGKKINENIIKTFKNEATIIRTSLFDRFSALWFLWKIPYYLFKSTFVLEVFLRKYNIDIISHSNIIFRNKSFKTINWIPDFQHIHLINMFSQKEIISRNNLYKLLIKYSNAIVVSSNDSKKDLISFYPNADINKIYTVNFVSQTNHSFKSEVHTREYLFEKYNLKSSYFYLPNQFWKHKNHITVFKAIVDCKKENPEILVVCSGNMNDDRDKNDHISKLKQFIADNDLTYNIKLLGLIDYQDVITLIRHSVAVINPSLFEGWSSTVEECKSVGKKMILSDIAVHREQDPPQTIYFNPTSHIELSEILKDYLVKFESKPDLDLETVAGQSLLLRTKLFAHKYTDIINCLI